MTVKFSSEEMLYAAKEYVARGWIVHPLARHDDPGSSPGKRPLLSEWQKLTKTLDNIGSYIQKGNNIGLVCGKASGVMVIDLDHMLFLEDIFKGFEFETLRSRRTEGREHIYFQYDPEISSRKHPALGIEILSESHNAVLPPSIHKSGEVYKWINPGAPVIQMSAGLKANLKLLFKTDDELNGMLGKCRSCFRDVIKQKPNVHGADGREYMLAVCTDLKAAGAKEEHIRMFAKLMYREEYDEKHTLTEWDHIDLAKTWRCETLKAKLPAYVNVEECEKCEQRRQDKKVGLKDIGCFPYHKTDLGNGKRLVDMFRASIRYCYPWKSWLVWNGKHWDVDKSGKLQRYARKVIDSIYGDAGIEEDLEERKRLLLFAMKSESASSFNNMIELACSEEGVSIFPETFDTDPWLFNVQNGTLDLRTGLLRPHAQNEFITKISPVTFDPAADCPEWKRFLNSIFNNNQNIIEYIQRKSGYILTGVTREEDLDILYGIGGNGKSKLTGALIYLMGDYHTKANIETIQATKQQSSGCASSDVACLKGARLVSVSEPEKGTHLNESRVKDLTGRDPIKARRLYQEAFEFLPEFKLWLYTNFKPIIRGQDRGIWRRIKLIPFEVCIPDEQQDKNLDIKLQAEAAGILNWCLEGCLKWQKDGLKVPDEILEATAEYKDEMDVFGEFFKDCCVLQKGAVEYSLPLHTIYKVWCGIQDYNPYPLKKFISNLEERGYKRLPKNMRGVSFLGLKLQRHISDAYEEMKTIHGGFNYDAVTQMTQFMVNNSNFTTRESLCDNASSTSFVSTVAQSASCFMTQNSNNAAKSVLNPKTDQNVSYDANDANVANFVNVQDDVNDANHANISLETLDTKIEKFGKLWQEKNQKSINSLTKTDFVFWYCEQNKNDGNTPSEIMPIVERIFKITPPTGPEQKSPGLGRGEDLNNITLNGTTYAVEMGL
ncbi:MAG: bifunctional DNA primase/polymerase [Candidatus Methanoperedens sp.]|nr:bifunctional DNA primase/polymerase [Candidatus Methanoperedens sp.]